MRQRNAELVPPNGILREASLLSRPSSIRPPMVTRVVDTLGTPRSWFDVKDQFVGPPGPSGSLQPAATGNGTTDDAPAIQRAINAARTAGGGLVHLPVGTYRLNSAITVASDNVGIKGVGAASRLAGNFAAGDILVVNSGTTAEVRNCNLSDFAIISNVAKTSGAAIAMTRATRANVSRILAIPAEASPTLLWDGIRVVDFDYSVFDRLNIAAVNDGFVAHAPNFGAGLWIGGGCRIAAGNLGVHFGGGVGGVVLDAADIINCRYGVVCTVSLTNAPNREVFLNEIFVDGSGVQNVNINPNGVELLHLNNTWLASAGGGFPNGSGITVAPPQSGICQIIVSGCRIFNNLGAGIVANAGSWTISGCSITNNGRAGGEEYGVVFANAAAQNIVMSGNCIIANGPSGSAQVRIQPGVDFYAITGNVIRGSLPIQDVNAPGPSRVIASNVLTA